MFTTFTCIHLAVLTMTYQQLIQEVHNCGSRHLQFWQRVIQNPNSFVAKFGNKWSFKITAVNHLVTVAAKTPRNLLLPSDPSPKGAKGLVRVVCQAERGMTAWWHSRLVVPVSIISEQRCTTHLSGTSRCMNVKLLPFLSWNHLCFVMCFVLREPAISSYLTNIASCCTTFVIGQWRLWYCWPIINHFWPFGPILIAIHHHQ